MVKESTTPLTLLAIAGIASAVYLGTYSGLYFSGGNSLDAWDPNAFHILLGSLAFVVLIIASMIGMVMALKNLHHATQVTNKAKETFISILQLAAFGFLVWSTYSTTFTG